MMIRLTCKCSECEKHSDIWNDSNKCENCNGSGKTVTEFKYEGVEGQYTDSDHILYHFRLTGNGIRIFGLDNKTDITESINPLFLEVIEEQECPECDGVGRGSPAFARCINCTASGRVELVTFTGFFGDMKEYDENMRAEGFGSRLVEPKESG